MQNSKSQKLILGIIVLSVFCGLVFLGISKNATTPKIKKALPSSLYLYSVTGRNYQADIGSKNNPNTPKVKFASAKSSIEFSPDNINESSIKQEKPDEKSVTYKNLWPGISIKYSTFTKGIKEEIVIDSLSAWENYLANHQSNFEFTIKTDNSLLKKIEIDNSTYYYFVDPQTDKYRFKFEKPFMVDANRKRSEAVTLQMKDESVLTNKNPLENYLFLITPNLDWLKQAKFPVIIDPTTSVSDLYNDTTKINTGSSSGYTVTGGQLKIDLIPWYNSGGVYWDYREPITYDNSGGGAKANYDVLIIADTKALVDASKLQSDCDDLRFTDTDKITEISYWIESGCNTTTTQIWVRIPDIAASTSETYYMYYGNGSAAVGQQSWSGNLIVPFNASLPVGWTSVTAINSSNKYIMGASSYGTTGGSSASHTHANSGNTDNNPGENHSGTISQGCTGEHNHTASITSTAATITQKYYDLVFGSKSSIPTTIEANSVLLFTVSSGSLPGGWANLAGINGRFPRGNTTNGGTAGSNTHSHTFSDTTTGSTTPADTNCRRLDAGTLFQLASTNVTAHTHTITGTSLSTTNNEPPYLDIDFATNASSANFPTASVVHIFDALPPLGWTPFSSLDNTFTRGSATYGGTGGSSTHDHDNTTGESSGSQGATQIYVTTGTQFYPLRDVPNWNHSHTYTLNWDPITNLPPYITVIFATRNSTAVATTVGNETYLSNSATIQSINLLANEVNGVASIDSFVYNLSAKPAGTTASAQFSQNATDWYDSAGNLNGWDTLTTGTDNTISLSTLNWKDVNFYYKVYFAGHDTTPVLDDITLNYTTLEGAHNCTLEESPKNNYIIINWLDTNPSEDGYEIGRAVGGTNDWFVDPIATTSASVQTYTDTNVSATNIYRYRIRAKLGVGHSPWCYTDQLNLAVGNFTIEGIKVEGVKIE